MNRSQLLRWTQAVHTISCTLFTHVKPVKCSCVIYVTFTRQWKSTFTITHEFAYTCCKIRLKNLENLATFWESFLWPGCLFCGGAKVLLRDRTEASVHSYQAFNTTASHWLIHLLFIVKVKVLIFRLVCPFAAQENGYHEKRELQE